MFVDFEILVIVFSSLVILFLKLKYLEIPLVYCVLLLFVLPVCICLLRGLCFWAGCILCYLSSLFVIRFLRASTPQRRRFGSSLNYDRYYAYLSFQGLIKIAI